MECTLTRLSKSEDSGELRTNEVRGTSGAPPTRGFSFKLLAPPIVEGANGRLIITSSVTKVLPQFTATQRNWEFTTQSGSVYLLSEVAK